MKVCFGIADRQISSTFDSYLPGTSPIFSFLDDICFGIELSAHSISVFYFQDYNLSKSHWIFTKCDVCIDIVEICFGIAHWQISSIFDRVISLRQDNDRVLSFHNLFCLK